MIFALKDSAFALVRKIEQVGFENCKISEITVAELKYGIAKSTRKIHNQRIINSFLSKVKIVPIFSALDIYAEEKARLKPKVQLLMTSIYLLEPQQFLIILFW